MNEDNIIKPKLPDAAIFDFTGTHVTSRLDLDAVKAAGLKVALYLDDVRTPTHILPGYMPWIVVRNFKEFASFIMLNGIPDFISFDHDLHPSHYAPMQYWDGDYELWACNQKFVTETGLDCVKWLILWCESHPELEIKDASIHSMNTVRAHLMRTNINGYKQSRGWDPNCFEMKHPCKEN